MELSGSGRSKRRKTKSAANQLTNMNRSRQMLTRSQNKCISTTFPLLDLPAELRIMIYEYCLDFSQVTIALRHFVRRYGKSDAVLIDHIPVRQYDCAAARPIFHLCRQVYRELQAVMQTSGMIVLSGTVIPYPELGFFVAPKILQNLAIIKVDDHDLGGIYNPRRDECCFFHFTMDWLLGILHQLGGILKNGHHLRLFALEITDPEIRFLLDDLYLDAPDRLQHILDASQDLRNLRGVQEVRIVGLPDRLAQAFRNGMQRPHVTFMTLPAQLREKIYLHYLEAENASRISDCFSTLREPTPFVTHELALMLDDTSKTHHSSYRRTNRRIEESPRTEALPKSAPGLLLVSKAIREEFLQASRKRGVETKYGQLVLHTGPPLRYTVTNDEAHPAIDKLTTIELDIPLLGIHHTLLSVLNTLQLAPKLSSVTLRLEPSSATTTRHGYKLSAVGAFEAAGCHDCSDNLLDDDDDVTGEGWSDDDSEDMCGDAMWAGSSFRLPRTSKADVPIPSYAQWSEHDRLLNEQLDEQSTWSSVVPASERSGGRWCALRYQEALERVENEVHLMSIAAEQCDATTVGFNACCQDTSMVEAIRLRGVKKLQLERVWPRCIARWVEDILQDRG